jgi:hypothetical protein|tara:strand:- start:1953 stop:2180 length:228 start_codon:yes stop_codon:yes gene_type:complete
MRTYVIANTSEASAFDFSQLVDINESSSRKSLDGSLILARYEGSQPSFLDGKTEYTHSEILTIMATAEWSSPDPE